MGFDAGRWATRKSDVEGLLEERRAVHFYHHGRVGRGDRGRWNRRGTRRLAIVELDTAIVIATQHLWVQLVTVAICCLAMCSANVYQGYPA